MDTVRVLRPGSLQKNTQSQMRDAAEPVFWNEIGKRIFWPVDLEEALGNTVQLLSISFQCDGCFLYLLENDVLCLRASASALAPAAGRPKVKLDAALANWLGVDQQFVAVDKKAHQHPLFSLFYETAKARFESLLSMPLVSRGRVLGLINLQKQAAHSYDPDDICRIAAIARMLAAAIEIALLAKANSELSDQLETRKLVERAKGLLQRNLGISEEAAYGSMQSESCRRRISMRNLAAAIVLNEDLTRNLSCQKENR